MEGTQIASNLTRREHDILFGLCAQHDINEFCHIWGAEPRCYHAYIKGKITKAQGVWLEAVIEAIKASCRWGY